MVFFHIICHRDAMSVKRLLSWIYNINSFYYISVDAKSQIAIDLFELNVLSNVYVDQRIDITWGGPSLAHTMGVIIRSFSQNYYGLSHYINLSEDDLPLVIFDEIKKKIGSEVRSYINTYPWLSWVDWQPMLTRDDKTFPNSHHISWKPSVRVEYDITLKELIFGDKGAIMFPPVRAGLHCTEDPSTGLLTFRRLRLSEAVFRSEFFRNNPYKVGRQWVMLHWAHCNLVVKTGLLAAAQAVFDSIFIADEALLQTVFQCSAGIPGDQIYTSNLRFAEGSAVELSDDQLDQLVGSEYLFGRKLSEKNNSALISTMNDIHSESMILFMKEVQRKTVNFLVERPILHTHTVFHEEKGCCIASLSDFYLELGSSHFDKCFLVFDLSGLDQLKMIQSTGRRNNAIKRHSNQSFVGLLLTYTCYDGDKTFAFVLDCIDDEIAPIHLDIYIDDIVQCYRVISGEPLWISLQSLAPEGWTGQITARVGIADTGDQSFFKGNINVR